MIVNWIVKANLAVPGLMLKSDVEERCCQFETPQRKLGRGKAVNSNTRIE
jgi:hypothetical protein